MKKILILTASTGGGHNQVARTLEAILEQDAEVKRVDFLKEENKIMEMIVAEGYDVLATKFPELYGRLYRFSNKDRKKSRFNEIIRRMVHRRVREIIKDYEPDLVIGCHTFAISIMSTLKMRGYFNKKFISIITDFDVHYSYVNKEVDLYITGSDYTGLSLEDKGIPKEKIYCVGIPVSPIFYEKKVSKNQVRFSIYLLWVVVWV